MFYKKRRFAQENTCVGVSFLIKLQAYEACNFIKKDPTQAFSCEIFKIFKNTYFEEHLRAAVSQNRLCSF